jgi:uncharacterized protein YegP (UPF0339 family)
MEAKFEVYEGSGGKFYWHLRRANGQTIASGGPYAKKDGAEKAIESVKIKAPDATVVHLDKPPKPLTPAELAHEVARTRQKWLKEYSRGRKVKIQP